jgi:hypothetical protein
MAIQCKGGRGSQKMLWFGRLDMCKKIGQRIFGFHYLLEPWTQSVQYNYQTKSKSFVPSLTYLGSYAYTQNEYTLRLTILSVILTYSKKGNTEVLRKWESYVK